MTDISSRLAVTTCVLLALLVTGCRSQADSETPRVVTQEVTRLVTAVVTVEATPIEVTRIVEEVVEVTAEPVIPTGQPKDLVVCMVNEPTSLYLYDDPLFGIPALARQAVLHAVHENLYTTLSYGYQPQGLAKLPDVNNEDVEIRPVTVKSGDVVVDASDSIVVLAEGMTILDADGGEVSFDGTPLVMSQMAVQFTFKPMVWSDGVPVTAADSVFSFQIAADPNTSGHKTKVARTASYEAVSDMTVEWVGIPGWLDPAYFTNVWQPLPAHQLGDYAVAELAAAPETNEKPLSSGPFVISEWVPGDHIRLVKNEHYYRSGEGLPYVDTVTFQFVQNTNKLMALLLAGQCDIGTQDGIDISQGPLLLEAESSQLLSPVFQTSTVFEHIDFGINPTDRYAESRPDWFEDVRVRQAMVMCTDRQAMVDEVLLGLSQVAHAYVPSNHTLFGEHVTTWPYDAERANAFLDLAGYRDLDEDGKRQDPETGVEFEITLGINLGNQMRQEIAQMFQANMADCGIEVEIFPQSAAEWFAPEGPLFGRRFDLAQFPWITGIAPACDLYTTSGIPTERNSWSGNNETGWSNPDFDAACAAAQSAFFESDSYIAQHQAALSIFSENVPVIPLFSHLKLAAISPRVRNFRLDPTQESELWNLYQLDLAPD